MDSGTMFDSDAEMRGIEFVPAEKAIAQDMADSYKELLRQWRIMPNDMRHALQVGYCRGVEDLILAMMKSTGAAELLTLVRAALRDAEQAAQD